LTAKLAVVKKELRWR